MVWAWARENTTGSMHATSMTRIAFITGSFFHSVFPFRPLWVALQAQKANKNWQTGKEYFLEGQID
jgi:hypothetical protein